MTLRLQRKVHKKVIDPMCSDAITFFRNQNRSPQSQAM
jgi:hypothetical protein